MSSKEKDELDVLNNSDEDIGAEEILKAKKTIRAKAKKTERPSAQIPEEETKIESNEERNWYVIHCYSGYENKVRHNLEQRIDSMGMKDKIFDVVIPTQEEIEVKDGKRKTIERHIFPGYVLVNMILTEESWFIVSNTPGVTGFVGMGKPTDPLTSGRSEFDIKRMEAEAPVVSVTYKVGEKVRIIDGPFNVFAGRLRKLTKINQKSG
jgi:transcriptional antiterminator NusG